MLAKNFSVVERINFQFRFEAFNAFNHARFPAPNADPTSSSFGIGQKESAERRPRCRMALKLTF